jgi:hypothetical protein
VLSFSAILPHADGGPDWKKIYVFGAKRNILSWRPKGKSINRQRKGCLGAAQKTNGKSKNLRFIKKPEPGKIGGGKSENETAAEQNQNMSMRSADLSFQRAGMAVPI